MNIIDVLIIVFLLFGGYIGFKRGLTKQLLSSIGLILVVVLAFVFKNPVSTFMYENLPFFKFGGVFKGVTVLNILVYEVIAFFLVLAILLIILRVLIFISGIFETFLKMTIVLGIPSKILGGVLGIVENLIVLFILLYVFTLPIFGIDGLNDSELGKKILKNTPYFSSQIDKSVNVAYEFIDLKEKYEKATNPNEFNLEALDLLLKRNIITIESVDKLIEKEKLKIENIETVLKKYREE